MRSFPFSFHRYQKLEKLSETFQSLLKLGGFFLKHFLLKDMAL